MEPFFPVSADPTWVLGTFVAFLLIFHLIFLKVWRLSERKLKAIDYYLLGITVLGLLGNTGQVRKLAAENQLAGQNEAMDWAYEQLRHEVRFLHGPAVSRTFVRSEFSPDNFESIQKEYDNVAAFAKKLDSQMPSRPPADLAALRAIDRAKVTDDVLLGMLKDLDRRAQEYLNVRKRYLRTKEAQANTATETVLIVVAPLLFAVALALAITKVTLERAKGKQTLV